MRLPSSDNIVIDVGVHDSGEVMIPASESSRSPLSRFSWPWHS
jgi:hypothetical protein